MRKDEPFEWDDEDTVIHAQGETCVYRNSIGQTVIRQRSPFTGDDDAIVVVGREFLPALIRKIQQHHAENIRGEE